MLISEPSCSARRSLISSVRRSMVACFFAAARWKRLTRPQPISSMSRSSDVFWRVANRSLQMAVVSAPVLRSRAGTCLKCLRRGVRGVQAPERRVRQRGKWSSGQALHLIEAGGLSAGCAPPGQPNEGRPHRREAEGNRKNGVERAAAKRQLGPDFCGCGGLAAAHVPHLSGGRLSGVR